MAKNVSRTNGKSRSPSSRGASTLGPSRAQRLGVFSWFDRRFNLNHWLGGHLPVQYLDRAVWVALLLLVYIGLTHHAERLIKDTDKLKRRIEELRADYTLRKADFMKAGKQSEISKRVAPLGLVEAQTPPEKVVVKTKE